MPQPNGRDGVGPVSRPCACTTVGLVSELHELSALDLGRSIAEREVSPVEVTQHFLDRIEADDGRLGAFVTVTRDLALRQAVRQQELVARGELASPLAGVPVPIK